MDSLLLTHSGEEEPGDGRDGVTPVTDVVCEKMKDQEATNLLSPPLFVTLGKSSPPPSLQWLETADSDSDDDDDIFMMDIPDACSSMMWPKTESSEVNDTSNWVESFWEALMNACGFSDAVPIETCSYAWV